MAVFVAVSLVYTQVVAPGEARRVPWRDLTAELGPVPWPRQVITILRRPGKLETILRQLTPKRAPRTPRIDFRRRTAFLVAVGPRSSTGYELRIERIVELGDRLVVTLRERAPTSSDPVEARLTHPYRLVTIPATEKRIFFRFAGRP